MQAFQIAALAIVSAFSSSAAIAAESQTGDALQPFGMFIETINSPQAAAAAPIAAASALAAPAQAQSYLRSLYATVDPKAVKHSFVDANDTVFDCIPIAQQPSLHGSTAPLPTPTDLPKASRASAPPDDEERMPANISANEFDRFGNAMACADGAIPMARVTPERLARFSSLKAFFQKAPDGGAIPPRAASVPATHRWAHAYEDSVPNLGGHSFLNLWDPAVGNAIFSLSQHWYTAGAGSGLQTLETGWQVFPQQYKTKKPVLFIYWTADGYNNTGCYNLTCSAFVQTNAAWALGGALKPVSAGKKQYTIELSYYLNQAQGRWWLYVNGTAAANAIGYFPASLYGGGPLSFGADNIDYGGEVVGTTRWPPMGSGKFAAKGYGKAAYQSDIFYYPTGGGVQNASLTPSQLWPWDFTATANFFTSPFLETIYFGGPGGKK